MRGLAAAAFVLGVGCTMSNDTENGDLASFYHPRAVCSASAGVPDEEERNPLHAAEDEMRQLEEGLEAPSLGLAYVNRHGQIAAAECAIGATEDDTFRNAAKEARKTLALNLGWQGLAADQTLTKSFTIIEEDGVDGAEVQDIGDATIDAVAVCVEVVAFDLKPIEFDTHTY